MILLNAFSWTSFLRKTFLVTLAVFFYSFLIYENSYAENVSTYFKSGFYAGIEAGAGNTSYSAQDVFSEAETATQNILPPGGSHFTPPYYITSFVSNEINDKGIAGRIYGGYQFNSHFAIETGFTQFHKTDFKGTGSYSVPPCTGNSLSCSGAGVPAQNVRTVYDGEITENAIDFVGKLTMPLQSGWGVFAKGGLAYIDAKEHINSSETLPIVGQNSGGIISTGESVFLTKTQQAIRPTYGVGLSYTIPTTMLNLDASWMQILGGGSIPKANLLAIGVSDKFA